MKSQSQIHIKKSQRGYSLIELSIVLAIIAVIIAGAIFGVQAILRANNVNKTISQTNIAVNKIVAKLIRDNNYAGATTQNLSAQGQEVWDANAITNGGAANADIQHPFGNSIFVRPLSAAEFNLDPNQAYVYTLTGIPVAACSDLAAGLEGLALAASIRNGAALANNAAAPDLMANAGASIKRPVNGAAAAIIYSNAVTVAACTGNSSTADISLLIPRR